MNSKQKKRKLERRRAHAQRRDTHHDGYRSGSRSDLVIKDETELVDFDVMTGEVSPAKPVGVSKKRRLSLFKR